jgi:calcium permeable stress-gated cation channel
MARLVGIPWGVAAQQVLDGIISTPGVLAPMVVVLVLTILFQIKLVSLFDPLIKYLPIDIQEELASQVQDQKLDEGRDLDKEKELHQGPQSETSQGSPSSPISPSPPKLTFEPDPPKALSPEHEESEVVEENMSKVNSEPTSVFRWRSPSLRKNIKELGDKVIVGTGLMKRKPKEIDENEDIDTSLARKFMGQLTHDERIAIAFQHSALRARPPIVWIPEDELGIARDEIEHTKMEYGDEIEISCDGATLDSQGKIQWFGNPPDYVYIESL